MRNNKIFVFFTKVWIYRSNSQKKVISQNVMFPLSLLTKHKTERWLYRNTVCNVVVFIHVMDS